LTSGFVCIKMQDMEEKNRNYQKELDRILEQLDREGEHPRLLLHSCCAPCSTYCLEYLSGHFEITDYYYNPNITEKAEYELRTREMQRLIHEQEHKFPVTYVEGAYEPEKFFQAVRGLEDCPEGGRRCEKCFRLRLQNAVEYAAAHAFPYVTTTLTISPMKDARLLNSIGEELANKYGIRWLPSIFRKKGGYQRSVFLTGKYGLYRQNYCGCVFSKRRDYVKLGGKSHVSDVTQ
jgi:predicted adenine nucleotide alpha hydrolase (AANH) superfamily ATPase